MKLGIRNSSHFKRCAFAALGVATLLGCGTLFLKSSGMSDERNRQVSQIVEKLGADNDIMFGQVLKDNGDEPVYVSFSEDYDDSTYAGYKESAIYALDYVFGAVGGINNNYKYEIVSQEELDKPSYKSKSVIQFHIDDLSQEEPVGGNCCRMDPWYIIKGDSFRLQNSKWGETELNYVYTHELLHAFGFKDIYEHRMNNEMYAPTIMTPKGYMTNLTVNDYALLMAYYSPQFDTQEQLDEFVDRAQDKLAEYQDYYYQSMDDLFSTNSYTKSQIKTLGDISFPGNISSIKNSSEYATNMGKEQIRNYDYSIEDEKYVFTITDENGKIYTQSHGDVVYTKNFIHLKDVQMPEGISPQVEGFKDSARIDNIMITKFGDSVAVIHPWSMDYNTCNNQVTYANSTVERGIK
ncbi:MAG: hypothetical protein IJ542_02245 [Clostridia bacterium]|nr:hypothetical protein [Clostridia bacterium]